MKRPETRPARSGVAVAAYRPMGEGIPISLIMAPRARPLPRAGAGVALGRLAPRASDLDSRRGR